MGHWYRSLVRTITAWNKASRRIGSRRVAATTVSLLVGSSPKEPLMHALCMSATTIFSSACSFLCCFCALPFFFFFLPPLVLLTLSSLDGSAGKSVGCLRMRATDSLVHMSLCSRNNEGSYDPVGGMGNLVDRKRLMSLSISACFERLNARSSLRSELSSIGAVSLRPETFSTGAASAAAVAKGESQHFLQPAFEEK